MVADFPVLFRDHAIIPASGGGRMMFSPRSRGGSVAFWLVRLASTSMRGLGLVATQTLMLSLADIEGSAAMSQRLRAARAGVLADHHWLIRVGQVGQVFQLGAGGLPAGFLPPRSLEGVRQC
jgi:hypothetical protein